MKVLAGLLAILLATGAITYMVSQSETTSNLRSGNDESKLYKEYVQWKSEHDYNMNGDEDQYRFAIYKQNKKIVETENAKAQGSLVLGMNKFAALTLEEFVDKYTTKMTQQFNAPENKQPKKFSNNDIPASVDWVKNGAVAPVEDQGSCGSCWAFSTKEGLEGLNQIVNGKLQVFSAQQLVDCSTWNLGCNGGDPMTAYKYTKNNGIELESSYPYTAKDGKCQYNKEDVVFSNKGQVRVSPQNNAQAIMEAAANQPLTIEVAAGNVAFQLYKSGVLDSSLCGTALDHGVLLTGYNTQNGNEPYFTIKNSWGTKWGINGYANIIIQQTGAGMCGINQYAAYPTN